MDRKKAIGLLKQKSKEAVFVASLSYNNNEFLPWRRNIEDILESAFSVASTEYKRVAELDFGVVRGTKVELQRAYVRKVHRIQQEVDSIVQKYERLGIESEPVIPEELKDTVKLPLQLYGALQFHPKVIAASRELFKDGYYRDAILRAFIEINNFVKEKTSLELDGKALMAQVFNKDNPVIKLNELRNRTEKDEQEGFMFLFMGAMVGIRNPKAHDNVIQTDPFRTLEYLALASLLMKRVEEGILVKTSPPRKKWNLQRFLADTRERCKQEVVDTITKLYDFTKSNSDSITWGTGALVGSFTFRKSGYGILASIFTVYSNASIALNFGEMKGKEVKEEILQFFRAKLNEIPGINVPEEAISIGKFPSITAEVLAETKNLKNFQDAVLALCQQIESGGK
ncbi:hypothetical protein ES707_19430 [subsurface metagenome]